MISIILNKLDVRFVKTPVILGLIQTFKEYDAIDVCSLRKEMYYEYRKNTQ